MQFYEESVKESGMTDVEQELTPPGLSSPMVDFEPGDKAAEGGDAAGDDLPLDMEAYGSLVVGTADGGGEPGGEVLAEVSGNSSAGKPPAAAAEGGGGGSRLVVGNSHSPSSDKENNESEKVLLTHKEQAAAAAPEYAAAYSRPRRKINDYIADKSLRIKSFLRRRTIPLRRLADLDRSCGTKSFMLQVNPEVDEAVYYGAQQLAGLFLSSRGFKLSDIHEILHESKVKNRSRNKSRDRQDDSDLGLRSSEMSDEEFFDTAKARKNSARAESGRKASDSEYLMNPSERAKRLKSHKESVFTKMKEVDSVCGSSSFVVVVSEEKECAFYHGDPHLVSCFFTKGVRRADIDTSLNVREFECDKDDPNTCSVPACIVSRNTLGKWRLAAIDLYQFPPELAMTLFVCPDEDRDRWIAEIDLNPDTYNFANKSKIAVCSLHFRDGKPTPENPYPSELLGDSHHEAEVVFRGKRPKESSSFNPELVRIKAVAAAKEILEAVLGTVDKRISALEQRKREEQRKRREREQRRRKDLDILRKGVRFVQFNFLKPAKRRKAQNKIKPAGLKRQTISKTTRFNLVCNKNNKLVYKRVYNRTFFRAFSKRTLVSCRFCDKKFRYTRAYFQHVRTVHVAPLKKAEDADLNMTEEEKERALQSLYPDLQRQPLDPKKKYICAVCKSVCDLYMLFMHMKKVHQGLLCQYCLKLFKKVTELETHLVVYHKVEGRYYHSKEQFADYSGQNYTFICSVCNVPVDFKQIETHVCKKTFDCFWCRQSLLSQAELESHIVNGWCPGRAAKNLSLRDVKLNHLVLTGKHLDVEDEGRHLLDQLLDVSDAGLALDPEVDSVKYKGRRQWWDGEASDFSSQSSRKRSIFSCSDRYVLFQYAMSPNLCARNPVGSLYLEDLPLHGTIFSGRKSKGISGSVKKELKESALKFDIEAETVRQGVSQKLAVSQDIKDLSVERAGRNIVLSLDVSDPNCAAVHDVRKSKRHQKMPPKTNFASPPAAAPAYPAPMPKEKPKPESKADRISRLFNEVNQNIEKLRLVIDKFVNCLFCQQCKVISVDVLFLLSHLLVVHSNDGILDILGEDTQVSINRVKRYFKDTRKKEMVFQYHNQTEEFTVEYYSCSYCSSAQCDSYVSLLEHIAEAHNAKVLTCNVCQNIFLNYGSLISHVCSGPQSSSSGARARFACKLCFKLDLSTFLEFQNHIRKEHNMCEICFKSQHDQLSLLKHCSRHDQDLMCMKCFVTFGRPESFRKHLFFKHTSESVPCAVCRTPTWSHVYHFCLPHLPQVCETCDKKLPNAAAYRVHQRSHTGLTPHTCSLNNCTKSFMSKSLLWKHQSRRHPEVKVEVDLQLKKRRIQKTVVKLGVRDAETVEIVDSFVTDLLAEVYRKIDAKKALLAESEPKNNASSLDPVPEKSETADPLDAAIRSIMPDNDEPYLSGDSEKGVKISRTDHDAVQATIAGRTYTADNSWQAGLDALLAGANMKVPTAVPAPTDIPPAQLLQTPEREDNSNTETAEKPFTDSDSSTDSSPAPVLSGLWNQDLRFVASQNGPVRMGGPKIRGGYHSAGARGRPPGMCNGPRVRLPPPGKQSGLRTLAPGQGASRGLKTLAPQDTPDLTVQSGEVNKSQPPINTHWEPDLSEDSSDEGEGPRLKKTPALKQRKVQVSRPLLDHDYCFAAYMASQQAPTNDLSEMDRILSNVAFGGYGESSEHSYMSPIVGSAAKKKRKKKKKDKKKKKKRKGEPSKSDSSTDSEADVDVVDRSFDMKQSTNSTSIDMFGIKARQLSTSSTPNSQLVMNSDGSAIKKRGPKPKYHTPDVAKTRGVMAGTARPSFDTDSSSESEKDAELEEEESEEDELVSSDLDTDFSADEGGAVRMSLPAEAPKAAVKSPSKPTLKLKIKLPKKAVKSVATPTSRPKARKRRRSSYQNEEGQEEYEAKPLSKKMRESLALNHRRSTSSSESEKGSSSEVEELAPKAFREEEEGTNTSDDKLYCYCQCPHDEVSEMIGCDAPGCRLEWFHFECVDIVVPPEGKWYCPDCTKRYGLASR